MPLLSSIARSLKKGFFLNRIPRDARVLEIGAGAGWVKEFLKSRGVRDYVSIDLAGTPDIRGDINDWRQLGLQPESFDYVIAFEVVEHVDCWIACHDLLRPEGEVLLTTPWPGGDLLLKILETLGLNQPRTSPHDHLIEIPSAFCRSKEFSIAAYKLIAGLSQWAVLKKLKPKSVVIGKVSTIPAACTS